MRQKTRQYLVLSLLGIVAFIGAMFYVNPLRAASITLSPATGVTGQEVFITGSAFDNSLPATITWDGAPLTTLPATVTTTAAGALPANVSFIVPSAIIGVHTVRISTSAQVYAVATFTVTAPSIAISSPAVPTAGLPVGVPVTITGSNFEGTKTVTIYFDNTSLGTATTSYNGAFEYTFPIPDVNNTGAHIIKAAVNSYSVANLTITVATPALTVLPATAPIGLNATLTGTNFKANAAVTFLVNGIPLTVDNAVTANGAGSFAVTFTVPDTLLQGANTIKAISYDQLYAVATLTVATPAITLAPATATMGMNVTITGSNYKANAPVTVLLNGTAIDLGTVTANSAGTFAVPFTVPDNILQGANTVKVLSNTQYYATATLTISTPAITLTPATAPVGANVTVTGTNFKANAAITLLANGTPVNIGTVTANSAGTFVVPFAVPDTLLQGANTIKALSNDQYYATTTLTVATPAITLTPSGATTAPVSPGLPVNIFGTNFKANAAIRVLVNGTEVTAVSAPVLANNFGEFGCVFNFPQVSPGISTIRVESTNGYFATTTVTVVATAFTLTPNTGPDNMIVHIIGSGFDSNAPVALYLDGNQQSFSATTNGVGFFTAQFTIPQGLQYGAHTLRIQTSDNSVANATYTVTAAAVTIAPATGAPGTLFTASGSNFDPKKQVYFKWNGMAIKPKEGTIITSSSGSFIANFIVPLSANVGVSQLEATTGDISTAFAAFTVAAPTLAVSGVVTANSVYAGSVVTLTGANFVGNQTVTFKWDNEVTMKTTPATVKTSLTGGFSALVEIPDNPKSRGTHTIVAYTPGQVVGISTSVAVYANAMTLYPASGQAGSDILVTGSSFPKNTKVDLFWDNDPKNVLASGVEVNEETVFNTTIKVPENATTGSHVVSVKRTGDDTNFVMLTAGYAVTEGTLTLSVDTANLGQKIVVTGKQFTYSAPVKLYWDATELKLDKELKTDSIGGFVYELTIPDSYAGKHTVRASTSEYFVDTADVTVEGSSIDIQPQKPRVGDTVLLTGAGFYPNKEITIKVNGRILKTNEKVMSDSAGNFKYNFKLPGSFKNNVQITASTNNYDQITDNYDIVNPYLWIVQFLGILVLAGLAYLLVTWLIKIQFFGKTLPSMVDFVAARLAKK